MSEELIVDLHIHSKYSRATSKHLNLEWITYWGKVKGINVIGTGDFTHPIWFSELKDKLVKENNGLYRLNDDLYKKINNDLPKSVVDNKFYFIPTVEISTIYKRHDKVRKVHSVIVVPDLEIALKINKKLDKIGNLKADGRPILGLDTKDLLEMTLESHPDSLFIPAHIWTPWFSIFGSKSGFDSLEEAFGDLVDEIKAVETGLSSDPVMNWQVSNLDGRTLVSHSDAHSPQKLGREANIINSDLTYKDIIEAIKTNDDRFVGTIEFYPQEGKYHHDGHRQCNISMHPKKSLEINNICPECKAEMTLGVLHRNTKLSDKNRLERHEYPKKVEYIIPLAEVIADINGLKSTNSKTVQNHYNAAIRELGDEFSLLRNIEIGNIKSKGFHDLAQAVQNIRTGNVVIKPGYDGVFGTIKALHARESTANQINLL